jgi:hypothetical protein
LVVNSDYIFITHLDVFLIISGLVDECAQLVLEDVDSSFSVKVNTKYKLGTPLCEVIIQNGPSQILVLGGLVGKVTGNTPAEPFFGFSFRGKIEDSDFTCYKLDIVTDSSRTYRHLIVY